MSQILIHGDSHQAKVASWTTALVECGQLCLSFNPIVGSFDHQYLMKESSEILVFGMELVIKGRQNLTPPLLVGCDHFCLLSNKITGKNLERIVSLKRIDRSLRFFGWRYYRGNVRLAMLIGCGQLYLLSNQIRIQNSVIINICGNNKVLGGTFN